MKSRLLPLVLAVIIVALDRWTKVIAAGELRLGQSIPVIPGFFDITLVFNRGAAFGILSGIADPWRRWLLLGVSFVAIVVVIYFFFEEVKKSVLVAYAMALILAGATGNMYDRIRYDAVVDFLDFYVGSYHWPAFNVADSAICIGVGLLLLQFWRDGKKVKDSE